MDGLITTHRETRRKDYLTAKVNVRYFNSILISAWQLVCNFVISPVTDSKLPLSDKQNKLLEIGFLEKKII